MPGSLILIMFLSGCTQLLTGFVLRDGTAASSMYFLELCHSFSGRVLYTPVYPTRHGPFNAFRMMCFWMDFCPFCDFACCETDVSGKCPGQSIATSSYRMWRLERRLGGQTQVSGGPSGVNRIAGTLKMVAQTDAFGDFCLDVFIIGCPNRFIMIYALLYGCILSKSFGPK